MRNALIIVILIVALGTALIIGCKSEGPSAGKAELTGTVYDAATGAPLSGVTIALQTLKTKLPGTSTQTNGTYDIVFDADSTISVTLTFTKSGYRDTTVFVSVLSNAVTPHVNMYMTPNSQVVANPGLEGGSGLAQTIAFLGATPTEVRVYGVGGQETAVLGWEARDSLGLPIDAAHAVDFDFIIANGPTGGEYVSPSHLRSNAQVRAFNTFNAGIRAGVAQIVAQATVNGRVITSSPVRVVIDAGFPVQSHFTVAPVQYNFPGMNWVGRRDAVSVLVGDIYSNPVSPGTAVYFHTSPYPAGEIGGAGVIEPSVFTDKDGEGTVNLISGNPLPLGVYAAHPALVGADIAYHWVVAKTVGQGGVTVQDSILIIWSGRTHILNVNPGPGFNIANGAQQVFTFTVCDQFGHPLAPGTIVRVSATVPPPPAPDVEVNQVHIAFGISGSYTLLDNLLPGVLSTDFAFTLSDGTSNLDLRTPVSIEISVTSQNDNVVAQFGGIIN